MFLTTFCIISVFISVHASQINSQTGPDPWNYETKPIETSDEFKIPPDIRMPIKRKVQTENNLGIGEWFFRRTLAMILNGGQTQQNEDGSVDISLQMKFEPNEWETLGECLKSETPLSEDMLRRTLGYVQESIYKPSFTEKIVLAWSDYVQVYLTEYKTYITWMFCFLAAAGGTFWLWAHMSHRHVIVIVFIIFYAYEVIISYKEAEQNELNKFVIALDRCKWFFWKSTCEVPPPDPLIFLKHMNPLKITMRMFTTALAEPVVALSGTVEIMLHGITDGLWFPLDKITYGVLTVSTHILLLFFLISIIFNWLLNIPFHLNFGLFGISVRQRERTLFSNSTTQEQQPRAQDADRISQATVNRILDVCSLALSNNTQSNRDSNPMLKSNSSARANVPSIRRSASTGRLPHFNAPIDRYSVALDNVDRRRNRPRDGSGDAL